MWIERQVLQDTPFQDAPQKGKTNNFVSTFNKYDVKKKKKFPFILCRTMTKDLKQARA